MPKANTYLQRPLTQVRRKDRVLNDEAWMDRLLTVGAVGHLALCWEEQPLLHGNLYWFDGNRVFWHTAAVGKLRAILDTGNARACFSVMEHGRILPAGTPFDFSTEYASVTLYGTARVVPDPADKQYALEGLMQKYAPQLTAGVDYEPMPPGDVEKTSVFCLEIEQRVGKHNVKPLDYPAYSYPGGSFIQAEREADRCTLRPKDVS